MDNEKLENASPKPEFPLTNMNPLFEQRIETFMTELGKIAMMELDNIKKETENIKKLLEFRQQHMKDK